MFTNPTIYMEKREHICITKCIVSVVLFFIFLGRLVNYGLLQ